MVLVPLFFLLRSGEAKTLPPQLYRVLGLANTNQGPIGYRGPGGDAAAKKFSTTATHCEIAPCPGIFFNIEKNWGTLPRMRKAQKGNRGVQPCLYSYTV